MGPVVMAGGDTVAARAGPHVFGKGRQRDGGRSPHSSTAYRWGHKWVVWSVLVKCPFALRPWALPVLVALSRDPAGEQAQGTRHQTPAHRARLLLARVGRGFPARQCILVGETGDGTSETAWFGPRDGRPLTLVRKFDGDAA
jgi:hypothetical protein